MRAIKNGARIQAPEKTVVTIEVDDGGTLRMADFEILETRAEFYEAVADCWNGSPQHLFDATEVCQPLAWAVHSIYAVLREVILKEMASANLEPQRNSNRIAALSLRLSTMPEEPYQGAMHWMLGLTVSEFESDVVPYIEDWFSESPNWNSEFDYLPESATAQGAALSYFRNVGCDELDTLGVCIVEGEHPGSSYYAAELRGDIGKANLAAKRAGLPVRFVEALVL